jgi:hypothetical protein
MTKTNKATQRSLFICANCKDKDADITYEKGGQTIGLCVPCDEQFTEDLVTMDRSLEQALDFLLGNELERKLEMLGNQAKDMRLEDKGYDLDELLADNPFINY